MKRLKKLLVHELVQNQLEILVNNKGKTQFILARRREDQYGDSKWQLFQGNVLLGVSAYRLDLYSILENFVVKSAWLVRRYGIFSSRN